jgi:hypothetical protein
MLSKQICQACRYDSYSALEHRWAWSDTDERYWRDGRVICPIDVCHDSSCDHTPYISGPPPKCCPYTAEHIVSQEVPEC